jgi:transcriptional regulator with XRE-family HTH domain
VAAAGSPTVRRRRLAAELRRLRGNVRTGGEVARALGWSPAKISRYELGQGGFPVDEVAKLIDFYGVTEPRRTQLLNLATDANARGWWEDYADALEPGYMDFIGLEAEAASVMMWQVETIPGLLQTKEYARCVNDAIQVVQFTPPGIIERRVEVRMIRQRVLTARDPRLKLSVTLDESALLREIGGPHVMRAQLTQLAEMAELPNVDLHVLPLRRESPLTASSFVIFDFSPVEGTPSFGDVVSLENVGELLSVEGESDTYQYRLLYRALTAASLSPDESLKMVRRVAGDIWRGEG